MSANKVKLPKDGVFVAGIWHQPDKMLNSEYMWTLSNTKTEKSTGGVAKTIDEAEKLIAEAKLWLGR